MSDNNFRKVQEKNNKFFESVSKKNRMDFEMVKDNTRRKMGTVKGVDVDAQPLTFKN